MNMIRHEYVSPSVKSEQISRAVDGIGQPLANDVVDEQVRPVDARKSQLMRMTRHVEVSDGLPVHFGLE